MTKGFTLIEMLVALVVLAMVVIGVAQGIGYGLRAWDAQSRLVDAHADLDAVDRVLRGLIARMDPGSLADPPQVTGSAGRLAFTSELPGDGPRRRADMVLAVDAAHRLTLQWRARRHARGGTLASSETVLLTGVTSVALSYLSGAHWDQSWTAASLPLLVRVHLSFPPGDKRHWPDIVARPAQDRPRE